MSYTSDLLRWLQRKRYQYEVTFSLYMLTPTEKFIFNSFLFLFLSMIIIAASLYLPEHVMTMISRAWFYYGGDEAATTPKTSASDATQSIQASYGTQEGKLAATRLPGQKIMDMLGAL